MGMFKWAEEESSGSPLFAAALGAGAVGAGPLMDQLNKKVQAPLLRKVYEPIVDAAHVGLEDGKVFRALKRELLDKDIAKHLRALPGGVAQFVKTKPNYLPSRAEVESVLAAGGHSSFEGKLNPIQLVKDIRRAGGFIQDNPGTANPVTLAHELGHATSLNKGSFIRNSNLFRGIDQAGRNLMRSRKAPIVAALLAGSFDSDDKTKWLVPGAIGATQAAVLGEEAIASLKGKAALDRLKDVVRPDIIGVAGEAGSNKLISPVAYQNAGKFLRRALGTYGIASAGLLSAPLLAIAARNEFDKTRD